MSSYYHFAELIYRQAEKYGDRTAIRWHDEATGRWNPVSWTAFAAQVRLVSQALIARGVGVSENIGIYSQNMPHCFYVDYGIYGVRAVSVPMYATSSAAQIEFIVRDAEVRLLFVGEQLQYDRAFEVQQTTGGILKQLVIFDPSVVRHPDDRMSVYFDDFLRTGDVPRAEAEALSRRRQARPEDTAAIVYTSGTSGRSKGVVLTHASFLEVMRIHDLRLPTIHDRDVSMCFLPFTHIFEKAWTSYCFHKGMQVAVNQDPKQIQQRLPEVRPTVMCNVPRFWEKVYAGVHEKINSMPRPLRNLCLRAIRAGRRYQLDFVRTGRRPPFGLSLSFHFYDKTIFTLLKRVLGLDRGRLFPVAGAPLADSIAEFLLSVHFPMRYGYGLSETSATVCFFPEKDYRIGSIGTLMPDLQVRIDPANQEILVKGKTVMQGYYRNPEATAEVFTEDGFFRTGDAGRLEGDTLFFLERIKDLFKTSNGKYIAPQAIELSLSGNKYVEQCAVIADKFKFVSALIVPAFPALEAWAKGEEIACRDREDLIAHPAVKQLFQEQIEESQQDFASYEKIKRFTLLAKPFSMETCELTDTLKLRRRVIAEHYAAEIAAMYALVNG
ncbi:MAG: long-chain fatty acid--CoA ligase [Tannerella sp.]|jgi:long-chain acyl-CoA synthetase|nr:long-chain fatty acid--CoA ligase [Tannerella sp.]